MYELKHDSGPGRELDTCRFGQLSQWSWEVSGAIYHIFTNTETGSERGVISWTCWFICYHFPQMW